MMGLMMLRKSLFVFISVFLMVFTSPVFADERIAATEELIMSLVERIQVTVENNPTPEEIRAETNEIIDEYFDYDLVARFAAGQAWRTATEEEKAAYKTAFREVLLSLAETQFEIFGDLAYTASEVIPKGEKLVVAQGIVHDKTGKLPDTVVAWRVSTPPGEPVKIIDIEVENISMLITQQQENAAIIRQNGGNFSALIDAMQQIAESIKKRELLPE
jgi:phospholipid transport system substrate-binding protein